MGENSGRRSRRRSPSRSSDSGTDVVHGERRWRRKRRRSTREIITEEEIKEYLTKKAQKKALRVAKKLKQSHVSGYYSNDYSNPFGDSNYLNEKYFVWRKKIERDVADQGLSTLDQISVKGQKKRQRERLAEIEKVKKRREERALEKARHEEEMAMLARERAQAEFQDWEKKEEEFHFDQTKIRSELRLRDGRVKPIHDVLLSKNLNGTSDDQFDIEINESETQCDRFGSEVNLDSQVYYWWHDEYRPRKPKYFNRVHTGYEWNKYNQTHYDHDNPPPKIVQGYKFNVFYPDLVDKTKAPACTVEKDGNSSETCLIRFRAGPPYEDIAFRIVNKDWEYSQKKGFKCTFERGILRVYFNFKRYPYRR